MRTIIVTKDTWLFNVKTGEMKKACDLTDIEKGAEEWAVYNRANRRKDKKLKRKNH